MYSGNDNVVSELISSYAWDTALNFICQTNSAGYTLATTTSSSYGNIRTNSRQNTGTFTVDNYSNIHDLLGNFMEWTTGYCSTSGAPCVSRGGNYNYNSGSADVYYRFSTSSYDAYVSFCLQLYVK